MELKEGMYVRTKYGISQYKQHKVIGSEDITGILCKDGSRVIFTNIEDIIGEPSFNPINLIEVGDYVNGYPVYETIEYTDNTRAIVIADDNKSIIWEESSQHIKSIVTKEQFESIKYSLEG